MPSRETLIREVARIIRFGIVGVANTAIYTVFYLLFIAVGVPYLAASISAFVVAISVAYGLNHRFTFRADSHTRQLVTQFFLVQGLGAAVNVSALALAVERWHWTPVGAQLVIIPPVVAMTFVANRLVVFRAHVDTR